MSTKPKESTPLQPSRAKAFDTFGNEEAHRKDSIDSNEISPSGASPRESTILSIVLTQAQDSSQKMPALTAQELNVLKQSRQFPKATTRDHDKKSTRGNDIVSILDERVQRKVQQDLVERAGSRSKEYTSVCYAAGKNIMIDDDTKNAQKTSAKESFQERINKEMEEDIQGSKFSTGEENYHEPSDELPRQDQMWLHKYDHLKQPGTSKEPNQVKAMVQAVDDRIQQKMQKDLVMQVGTPSPKYASASMITGKRGDQMPKGDDAIEDLDNRKMAAGRVSSKPAAKPWPAPNETVELIFDDDDLPLPPQMKLDEYDDSIVAGKKPHAGLNLIPEVRPPLPPQMQFDEYECAIVAKKKAFTNTNFISSDGPPVSPQMQASEFDDSLEKAKCRSAVKDSGSNIVSSTQRFVKDSRTLASDGAVPAPSQSQTSFESAQPGQTHSIPSDPVVLPLNEARNETPYVSINQTEGEINAGSSRTQVRRDPSAHLVPEAYLVDDHDEVDRQAEEDLVISGYAEPMPPWWKPMLKHVCCFICCAGTTSGIVIGILAAVFDYGEYDTCLSDQTLSFSFYHSSSSFQAVMDRTNMAVAVDDPGFNSVHLIFHVFNGWQWERVDMIDVVHDDSNYSLAVSGKTALLGVSNSAVIEGSKTLDKIGMVFIYMQNALERWEEAEHQLVPKNESNGGIYSFGHTVDIDSNNNLAAVGASNAVYIFRQDEDKWLQIDKIELYFVASVTVVGNTIAVQGHDGERDSVQIYLYTYDQALDKVESLQGPFADQVMDLALGENHLVYSTDYEMIAYHRQNTNETFSLLQKFDDNIGKSFALDSNILIFQYYDYNEDDYYSSKAGIFAFDNGRWEHKSSKILGWYNYNDLQLSDGRWIAMGGYDGLQIDSYQLDQC